MEKLTLGQMCQFLQRGASLIIESVKPESKFRSKIRGREYCRPVMDFFWDGSLIFTLDGLGKITIGNDVLEIDEVTDPRYFEIVRKMYQEVKDFVDEEQEKLIEEKMRILGLS